MISDEFFLHIQKHYDDTLPFVAYRKPNETHVKALLQKDETLHFITDFTESGFVFAPFDDHEKSVLIPSDGSEMIQSHYEISTPIETSQTEFTPDQDQKAIHIQLVEKAIEAIKENHLKKVVLSRRETIPMSD